MVVDKPAGPTSAAITRALQATLGLRRGVGHTGTLDPAATGVLPVCVGEATKVAGHLVEGDKAYEADVCLGVATTTLDADGEIVSRRGVASVTEEAVRRAAASFVGDIAQRPPMYSAVKRGGVRLHVLARRGETVERPARIVRVHAFDVLSVELPCVRVRVRCGKGTYVRALAADLGEALGCGAHLATLRRIEAGGFRIEEAVAWDVLVAGGRAAVVAHIVPLDRLLRRRFPVVELDAPRAAAVRQGQPVVATVPGDPTSVPCFVALFGPDETPLALGQALADGRIRPVRGFRSAVAAGPRSA